MRERPTGGQGLLFAAAAVAVALAVPGVALAAPVTKHDVAITASDGVKLSGDVHLPGARGRFPAIVDMEPYGRSSATTYLKDGYAHVNTDVRGSGKSGGALCLLCYREQLDVKEGGGWVARPPWSNRKGGVFGYPFSASTPRPRPAVPPPHPHAGILRPPPPP